jgi:hypothetical protein
MIKHNLRMNKRASLNLMQSEQFFRNIITEFRIKDVWNECSIQIDWIWVSKRLFSKLNNCSAISSRGHVAFWQDDDIDGWFVLQSIPLVFISLADWNNSPQLDLLLHSDTLSWFWANQPLFLPLNAVCLTKNQQISFFIVFCLTWLGLEPTIYPTPG